MTQKQPGKLRIMPPNSQKTQNRSLNDTETARKTQNTPANDIDVARKTQYTSLNDTETARKTQYTSGWKAKHQQVVLLGRVSRDN